jgi:hypothetical protein
VFSALVVSSFAFFVFSASPLLPFVAFPMSFVSGRLRLCPAPLSPFGPSCSEPQDENRSSLAPRSPLPSPLINPKEAHRVRVQIGVRFQRRGFRSPIRARSRESESKEESDLLWTRESESKEESDLLWISESESKEESDLFWTPESESKEESDLLWTRESESKGGSDLLWIGESDRVRSGKAFSWTRFIRPAFVWSVAEKGVVLMDSADLWSSNLTNNH